MVNLKEKFKAIHGFERIVQKGACVVRMKRQWLVLLLITALLLGSCFVYADEAATGGITIEIEGQEEGVLPEEDFTAKVSVDPSLDLESLALFAAFYEENGRFLGLKRITVDPETGAGSVAVDNSSELSTMKVFAIEKESASPVTAAAEAAQPKSEEPLTRGELACIISELLELKYEPYMDDEAILDIDRNLDGYQGIYSCLYYEYMVPYHDHTFRPDVFLTRAEVAAILCRVAKVDISTASYSPMPADVPEEEWYAPYVCAALQNGYLSLYKDGVFCPNQAALRSEIDFEKAKQDAVREPENWYNDGEAFVVTGEEPSEINLKPYLGAYMRAYQNGDGKITKIAEVCSEFLVGNIRNLRENYTMDSAEVFDGFVCFENGDRTVKTFEDVSGEVWLSVELDGMTVKTVYSALVWNPESTFMATDDVQDEIASDKMLGGFKFALDDQGGIDPFSFAIACKTEYYELGDISEDDVVTVYLNKEKLISRIEVGKKTVEGTVTNVQTSGSGTVRIYIDGKPYMLNSLSQYQADMFKMLMDNEVEAVFFLDYNGEIYDFYEVEGDPS